MRVHVRIPAPLPCAVLLAAFIVVSGIGRPLTQLPPASPAIERITGTIGGPIVRTAHGRGAPLHTAGSTGWLWTTAAIEPGQRVEVTGKRRASRGFAAPGSPDRRALIASRGASWELEARHVIVRGTDDGLGARVWRTAHRTQAVHR